MTTYIGIDASYTGCAVAFIRDDIPVVYRRGFPSSKHGSGVDRLVGMSVWLEDLLVDYQDDVAHVCLEGYSMGSKFGREQAGELGATIKQTLFRYLPYPVRYPTIVQPTALKKFVLGSGAAGKKNLMLLGVYKKWDQEFGTDDEADAYSLAQLARTITEGTTVVYEQEVIDKLKKFTEKV